MKVTRRSLTTISAIFNAFGCFEGKILEWY